MPHLHELQNIFEQRLAEGYDEISSNSTTPPPLEGARCQVPALSAFKP